MEIIEKLLHFRISDEISENLVLYFRISDEISEITEGTGYETDEVGNKLVNARSVLTLRPQEEDNDVYFRCDATNGALLKPHETMVQLSVMRKCCACVCVCVCVCV